MTFTEAAVEVLRLVGKPLHYRKITEVAIERNLLSHVGKTPEITMSSRLASMVRKDRGEAPITKIKPGVFGLREFSEDVNLAAEKESGHDVELSDIDEAKVTPQEESSDEGSSDSSVALDTAGEESVDDDDELIFSPAAKKDDEPRGKKRRRRRKKKEDDDESGSERESSSSRGKRRSRRGKSQKNIDGDWERSPSETDATGTELCDAIYQAMVGNKHDKSFTQVAESLISKGRLSGSASSLAPTIAASIRGDIARRHGENAPARFRIDGDSVSLLEWGLGGDGRRALHDATKAATRQRDAVRRRFLNHLSDLPAAGLMEVLATWLNTEGVSSLRGVRPPNASRNTYHLAGTLKQGPVEIPLAIVVVRAPVSRETLIDARGALHHYGNAAIVWVISTSKARSGAREEAAAAGAAPCAIFDGPALAERMEERGVGLVRRQVPVSMLDMDLLDALRGPGRKRDSGDDDAEESKSKDTKAKDSKDGTDKERPRRRRRRRKDSEDKALDGQDENAEPKGDADETNDDEDEVLVGAAVVDIAEEGSSDVDVEAPADTSDTEVIASLDDEDSTSDDIVFEAPADDTDVEDE